MDLGLDKEKQEALGEEAGNEGKKVLKSARNGVIASGNQFSEDAKDGLDWFGEKVLGIDYDKTHDGPNENGKTYRQVRDKEKQSLSEEQNRLEEESPYKDIFNEVKNDFYKGLNITGLVMAVRSLPALAKAGFGAVKNFNMALKSLGMDIKFIDEGIYSIENNSKKVTGKLSQEAEKLREDLERIFGKGVGESKSILDPRLGKYVQYSFKGVGKEAQDNFNKYLRENVWCDETLSNEEKIEIMKANFDKLTPEQKINFNVSNEVKVLKNPDYSNWGDWPDIDWPEFPGLNKDTAKSVYNEITGKIEIPNDLDRLGSPYGNNLGVVENGYHCTQNERSICYIENEYARNSYKFDGTYYKDAIDSIKDFDIDNPEKSVNNINSIIDSLNEKNGTNNLHITENNAADWLFNYKQFQSTPDLIKLCNETGIDSTYGIMGEAAPWTIKGDLITSGDAGQINTPINVKALEDMGIIQNVGGW